MLCVPPIYTEDKLKRNSISPAKKKACPPGSLAPSKSTTKWCVGEAGNYALERGLHSAPAQRWSLSLLLSSWFQSQPTSRLNFQQFAPSCWGIWLLRGSQELWEPRSNQIPHSLGGHPSGITTCWQDPRASSRPCWPGKRKRQHSQTLVGGCNLPCLARQLSLSWAT